MKDRSTKTPSARQIELGKTPKVTGGIKPYTPGTKKTNANASQTDTESKTQRKKRLKAEKETAEKEANGGMIKEDMIAMHTFMCKMSDMKPHDTKSNETRSANKVTEEMQSDYTTGLAALTEWSRMRKVQHENPWEKAEGYMANGSLP